MGSKFATLDPLMQHSATNVIFIGRLMSVVGFHLRKKIPLPRNSTPRARSPKPKAKAPSAKDNEDDEDEEDDKEDETENTQDPHALLKHLKQKHKHYAREWKVDVRG